MGFIAPLLATNGRFSLNFAETMLKGITPDQFARKPLFDCKGGPRVIDTNHPAFAYGHLSTYPMKLLQLTGLDSALAPNPPGFEDLFNAGKECRDDPAGTIYPSMEKITSHFFSGYRAAIAELEKLTDDRLSAVNPREGRMRDLFPTVGGMCNFMLTTHIAMHIGQVSAWRRCMGLGSAM